MSILFKDIRHLTYYVFNYGLVNFCTLLVSRIDQSLASITD